MIHIKEFNEIYYKLDTDYKILKDLEYYFSIRAPGFFFNPKYKSGIWDGFIHLFKDSLLLKGLYKDLEKYCLKNNIEIVNTTNDYNSNFELVDEQSLNEFISALNLSSLNKETKVRKNIYPYYHQLNALNLCLKNKKQLIESITSSGKSLIIYILSRYLQQSVNNNEKILIIVPSINLVNQMYNDFDDYAYNTTWLTKENCCKIFSGKDQNILHDEIYNIELEDGSTLYLHGNQNIKLINNNIKMVKNLTKRDIIDDNWIQRYKEK